MVKAATARTETCADARDRKWCLVVIARQTSTEVLRSRFSFAFARLPQQFAIACFGWGLTLKSLLPSEADTPI